MIYRNLKAVWRNLKSSRGFTLFNLAGLAVGMACTLLILIWVRDEWSYDRFHAHAAEIYRIVADWDKHSWNGVEGSPAPLASAAAGQIPEIVQAVRLASQARQVFRFGDKAFYENGGIVVDPAFFKMFSFPLLAGSSAVPSMSASDLVVSRTMALKYFGEENPIGKVLEVEGRPLTVIGIAADCPDRSHIRFDYLQSFGFIEELTGYGTSWGMFNFFTYVRIRPGSDPVVLGKKLTDLAFRSGCPQVEEGAVFRLQPLTSIHLDSRDYRNPGVELGDSRLVALFTIVAFFVLLIACFNFINLSTARSVSRAREIGVRAAVGASKGQLFRLFLSESMLTAVSAGLLALALVRLLLPQFNRLFVKHLRLDLLDPGQAVLVLAVILTAGLAAGLYPSFYLSRLKPAEALRGKIDSGAGGFLFRRILVVFQFTLSILLVIATLVVGRQLRFMQNRELAFDRNNLAVLPIKGGVADKFAVFKQELLAAPGILGVTAQNYLFTDAAWRTTGIDWEGRDPETRRDIIVHVVDVDFFNVMGIRLSEGRFFSRGFPTDEREAFIINQEAVKQMGISPPVGKPFNFIRGRNNVLRGKIIGVLKNGHFRSLHFPIEPHIFLLGSEWSNATDYGVVLVKIEGGRITPALDHIREVWERVNPAFPFEFRFLDDIYSRLHRRERRAGLIFKAFAGLAVGISLLGLLGLAAFSAQQRRKELGIRKVLGASSLGLVILLCRSFSSWVLLANLFAWPPAYFGVRRWMENYAYRAPLDLWIFLLAGASALILTWVIAGFYVFRAAGADPAGTLRLE